MFRGVLFSCWKALRVLVSSIQLELCKNSIPYSTARSLSFGPPDSINMVDPKRVVSYEDILKVINKPEKVLIDVRNPDEVHKTGKIPSSINIPLNEVPNVLKSMSNEEFQQHYNRSKPSATDELIFYCQSGRRSSEALDEALKLGFKNSKTYLGSWNEWSNKQNSS